MIDRERIAELETVGGGPLTEVVGELLLSVERTLDDLLRAISAGDLAGVWQAAHQARNEVLLLGARPLLAPLERLERAARDRVMADVRPSFEDLRASWPATRDELERAAVELQDRG